MALFQRLFDGSFMPHGYCLLWQPDLLFLYVAGDILTATSYFVIPTALIYYVQQRRDLVFNWIFQLFAAFILFCGITHTMQAVNIWYGYYYLEGITILITGLISALTAIMVWRLMPQALAMPSRIDLLEKNRELAEAQAQLRTANQQLEERVAIRTRELQHLAITDPLTGLNNRGEIMAQLTREMERARRYQNAMCILIADLDHFKSINDSHGHLTGDRVLVDAAQTFNRLCRASDSVGRFGGEEFLLVLPNTNEEEAAAFADRMRAEIHSHPITTPDGKTIHYSCCIGVSQFVPTQQQEELLHRADNALYQAKLDGRNRVVVK